MKKLLGTFENIWRDAVDINNRTTTVKQRFHKIYSVKHTSLGKRIQFGLYDSVTKRWSIFDSINLSGNFRYVKKDRIPEITEMKGMIKLAASQCNR